jgi:hypothetical protein
VRFLLAVIQETEGMDGSSTHTTFAWNKVTDTRQWSMDN